MVYKRGNEVRQGKIVTVTKSGSHRHARIVLSDGAQLSEVLITCDELMEIAGHVAQLHKCGMIQGVED